MPTVTSSFRIDAELKLRLDLAARRMNHNRNWIINQALNEYLSHHDGLALREEARCQSLAASRKPSKNDVAWNRAAVEAWNE
jgi:predicted transcriptional regulator